MAYATSNPPALLMQSIGGNGASMWTYNSTDAATVVRAAGYITNADALGIKVGDLVFHTDETGGTVGHLYTVNSVTAGGACDLTDGTAITATDTD